MGISDLSIYQSLASGLKTQQSQLQQLVTELGTGKQVNQPSDDPAGTAQVIGISVNLSAITQYQKNQAIVQTNLNTEDSVDTTVGSILGSVRDTANAVANSPVGDPTRTEGVTELNGLLQQVVQLANTQVGSNYIFGGFVTDKPPMTLTAGGAPGLVGTSLTATQGSATVGATASAGVYQLTSDGAGNVTLTNSGNPTQTQTIAGVTNGTASLNFSTLGVTITAGSGFTVAGLNNQTVAVASGYTYQGDANRPQVGIDTGQAIATNHTGDQLFGNAIASIQGAISALQTGSTDNVTAASSQVDAAQTQVLTLQSAGGIALQQITNAAAAQATRTTSLSQQEGNIVNIDTATVAQQLLSVQTSLEAAYEAVSRVSGLTLTAFLPTSGA